MSPEQARGLPVDKRTDIWAFGCVLYEMLTGRVTFAGDTVSDSIAKILEREPDWSALPAATPVPIRRLLLRCLAKDPKQRLRDFGDVRIEIDATGEVLPGVPALVPGCQASHDVAAMGRARGARRGGRRVGGPPRVTTDENPLANATFSRVTNWEGTEEHAEISPDGRFVAFVADKAGQLDVWVSQVGTGKFDNLTLDLDPLLTPGNLLRSLGFSGDGSEIWFNPIGNPGLEKVLMPLTGGTPRPFLGTGLSTPSWSPDDSRLAYIASSTPGDPLSIADRTGADARPIVVRGQDQEASSSREACTHHNPVWSPDGAWIYFVHGREAAGEMDVWRMRPVGRIAGAAHTPERTGEFSGADRFTYGALCRARGGLVRAVAVGARCGEQGHAPRDRRARAIHVRLGKPGWPSHRRHRGQSHGELVACAVGRSARRGSRRSALPHPKRIRPGTALRRGLTLLSVALVPRDWRWPLAASRMTRRSKYARAPTACCRNQPAASPDGSRVAVVVRQDGKRRLAIMSADGTNSRTLAASIDLRGVEGQGAADWSPDGKWIVTGGDDGNGPGLFKIPVDGSAPVRLVSEDAVNPVWSPTDDLIVYAIPFGGGGGRNRLRGVRPDGTSVEMPEVRVRRGGAHRFLRSGAGLVYLEGPEAKDFWLVDLTTSRTHRLTNLSDRGQLNHFDITPDGKYLVFDRSRQNSDVVLIDLPKK